jgi:hypothetical protein
MQNWWATKRNKKLSFNTCMFTYKCILCFNLLSIEMKIYWSGPPSPSVHSARWSGWTHIYNKTVQKCQVNNISGTPELDINYSIFGTKSLSQFSFLRCRSFTCSLRHREIDKNLEIVEDRPMNIPVQFGFNHTVVWMNTHIQQNSSKVPSQ